MNRTIQLVTEKLTGLLPESQEYYKPENLRSWGFPNFIVKRIQVELERNLAESMRLPETDWANMQSSEVQEVWKQFIRAIRNEAWLPASYARTVIETAVADVLEMLVEPRKNIPQAIYGAEDTLTREELRDRLKNLVVYRHFARLLPRYMEKKELDELNRERCAEIIKKADEKVTSRYTPLNWAQMLEPLFKLLNEQIESSLLRLFFEDKKMPRIARKFDFMEKPVNRAVLIETLSSPESLNMEGFEEDQSDLFGASGMESIDESDKSVEEDEKQSEPRQSDIESEEEQQEETDRQPEDLAVTEEDDSSEESFEDTESESLQEDEAVTREEDEDVKEPVPLTNKSRESNVEIEHEEESLNTIFAGDTEEDSNDFEDEYADDEEDEIAYEEEDESESGLHDKFETEEAYDADQESDEPVEFDESKEEYSEDTVTDSEVEEKVDDDQESDFEIKAEEKKETPMWQRFMSSEELEELAEQEEESSYNDEFEEYEEEPIFDLTMEKQPTEEEIAHLRSVLQDKQSYFVQEIFGGSERAYDEAIEKIAAKKGWRDASRFIEKEVFKRNMIDMYSEEAVDFTDRLHNYFIENGQSE
ncbi:hypothetical protein G3570_02995 [Balneolaceae bacterium YR4-1]|uniref:Uncharacterized protein n=1 Tax=Halalkalibaculum roseum TaxID=2709311 RepID=A0A6M1T5K5_9BACT|nr:hypothetical protein [Halalkalibaculum roseum]NGP75583.1 hypothetical protein [Halalkalibaculum roseum]